MSGEFSTIARLLERLGGAGPQARVVLGAGDDTAVLEADAWPLIGVDTLVQGTHWNTAYSTPEDVGYKLLTCNLSDIAAMGGEPGPFLLALALPTPFDEALVEGVAAGLEAARREHGLDPARVALIGGDTTATRGPAVLSLTLLGRPLQPGRLLRRDAAQPGDRLWVTGRLGEAAAGLALLQASRGAEPWAQELYRRHRRPRARLELVPTLVAAAGVHATIDLSDGLAGDLGHILVQSGVGAELWRVSLPISPEAEQAALLLGHDALDWALRGGEDYELLVSADPTASAALAEAGCLEVGRIVTREERDGIGLVEVDGRVLMIPARAYEHG